MAREGTIVVGMGWGAEGQLALHSRPDQVINPRYLDSLQHLRVSVIACGMAHSGVISDVGTLHMFGKGKYGRLGTGEEDDTLRPTVVQIGNNQRVTMLACGGFHTAAVTTKGELFTFGRGDSGQLGHGEKYNCILPLHVHTIHQKVTKIACGVDHTLCCTAQGELYAFGSNAKGQLGIGQSPQETYALPQRIDYRAYANGCSSVAYPSAVSCGYLFSAMILDGKVFTWGSNDKGQCGTGSTSEAVWNPTPAALGENVFITNLSCGLDHTLVVTELGRVYTWGSCEYGQLGIASDLLAIASGTPNSNNCFPKPMLVKEALLHEHVVSSSCGSYHSTVITMNGKLYTWGLGDKGQLGKAVEGSGVAPYPYNVRVKAPNSKAKDEPPAISMVAAGGRHTIMTLYNKPLISLSPSVFVSDVARLASSLSESTASFFDVLIYAQNDSATFDAHRIFLCRVPKLQSMLSESDSKNIQELKFPGVTRGCMAIVLQYIYTNKLPAVKDAEVAQLAKDWDLLHLYTYCVSDVSAAEMDVVPLSIQRHLKKFVNEPQYSDVTFVFSAEEGTTKTKIRAHKAILVLRCEFFLLEFGGNFKESSQSEVTIPDTSPESFLQLMHYLYSDEVPEQSDWVELLSMANLYQLQRLKTTCEQTITECVDVDNAAALYEIAQQCDAGQLLAFCDYFITTHYDRVVAPPDFKQKLLASKQQNFSDQRQNQPAPSSSSSSKEKCNVQ